MKVLVTGGAGYIGSVIAARLLAAGHAVTVYDDLSRGHRRAVPDGAALVVADIRDSERVAAALAGGDCEAIVHMAALAEVAESVAFPERYHDVNVAGTEAVLTAALRAGVSRLVFSSTAAVYGAPERIPIDEESPLSPANPYGDTKLAAERLLGQAAAASGGRLATVALRYFNAAGADGAAWRRSRSRESPRAAGPRRHARPHHPQGLRRRLPHPRRHLHTRLRARERPGRAHVAALERLPQSAGAFNLGTGSGSSVLEVLRAVAAATARSTAVEHAPRRPGDPPVLVASNERARDVLDWRPQRRLDDIVADAWRWMSDHPRGYADRGAEQSSGD